VLHHVNLHKVIYLSREQCPSNAGHYALDDMVYHTRRLTNLKFQVNQTHYYA